MWTSSDVLQLGIAEVGLVEYLGGFRSVSVPSDG